MAPAARDPKHPKIAFTKSADDADIVLTGGVQAGVNASPQYFWSVKASYPFYPSWMGRHSKIAPEFVSEASQQKNADPDSMKASVVFQKRWPLEPRGVSLRIDGDFIGYEFERTIKNEAVLIDGKAVQREFLEKNSNVAWAETLRFIHGLRLFNYVLRVDAKTTTQS